MGSSVHCLFYLASRVARKTGGQQLPIAPVSGGGLQGLRARVRLAQSATGFRREHTRPAGRRALVRLHQSAARRYRYAYAPASLEAGTLCICEH